MSKVQMLRVFVNQRLTAAAEEIFGLFERTIAEYEEQLELSTKEIHRQRKLLDSVFNPEVRLHRAEVQKLVVVEDIYEQQDWSASLDQEDPEPLQIKEEQGELWSCQEGEQLQGLEEADTKFTTPVPVKSEEDEETPQPSQLHQRQTEQMGTEADGEDCGGPEPARNREPDRRLEPATHETSSHSSEPETDGSGDWEEPKSGLNPLQNSEVPLSDMECNIAKTSIGHKGNLQKYAGIQTREQHFTCSVCKANFLFSNSLVKHMKIHNGEKPFSCSVCNKRFTEHSDLSQHLPVHTEEKPFSCSFCSKRFAHHSNLRQHLTVHTGEKPYSCSVCSKRFAQHCNLRQHLTVHTGEKPFSCSVCSKSFAHHSNLRQHLTVHTGEKPFSCSVCGKRFANHRNLRRHLTVHTGEKPFSCSVCGKQFTRSENVKQHKCVGERAGINEAAEMLVEPLFFQQD